MNKMSIHNRHHIQTFATNFELACVASILALGADIMWVIHDIITNGMGVSYGFIFTGLFLGLVLTIVVMVRHHKSGVKRLNKKLLKKQEKKGDN